MNRFSVAGISGYCLQFCFGVGTFRLAQITVLGIWGSNYSVGFRFFFLPGVFWRLFVDFFWRRCFVAFFKT